MKETQHNGISQYRKLALMTVFSFMSMFILMYSMVDRIDNVVFNVNQFYMAGLMTMPMVLIEMMVMSTMYMKKKWNMIISSTSLVILIVFFFFIREQGAVSDRQFLKSMIPHHGAAILMAEQAAIRDPDIKALAEKIIKDQKAEIALMKAKLAALSKK